MDTELESQKKGEYFLIDLVFFAVVRITESIL